MPSSELFLFHVGQEGAQRDFPRSLSRALTVHDLEPHVRKDLGSKADALLADLHAAFPEGLNCWGIPSGAQSVFKFIDPGDVVLLIGRLQLRPFSDGILEFGGTVNVVSREPLYHTSQFVWTEPRFPLMFFFEAQSIQLPWAIFLRDAGYKSNMDPHGRAMRVNPKRYANLPGSSATGYLKHILTNYPGS